MSRFLSNIFLSLNRAQRERYLDEITRVAKDDNSNADRLLARKMKKIESWNNSIFNRSSNKKQVKIKQKIVKIEFRNKEKNPQYQFQTKAAKECYEAARYLLELNDDVGQKDRKNICSHWKDFAYLKYGSGETNEIPISMQIETHRKTWFWPITVTFSEESNALLIGRNNGKLSPKERDEGDFSNDNVDVTQLRKNQKPYIVTYNSVERKYDDNGDSRFIAVFRQRHGVIDKETCKQISTIDPGQIRKLSSVNGRLIISLDKLKLILIQNNEELLIKNLECDGKKILNENEVKLCTHKGLTNIGDINKLINEIEKNKLNFEELVEEDDTPYPKLPAWVQYDAIDEYRVYDQAGNCTGTRKFEDDCDYASYISSKPNSQTTYHAWVRLRRGGKVYSVGKSPHKIGMRFAKDTEALFQSADNHEFEDRREIFRERPMQVAAEEFNRLQEVINQELIDKKEYNIINKNCVHFVFDIFKRTNLFKIEKEQEKQLNIHMLRVFFPPSMNHIIDKNLIPHFLIYLGIIITLPFRFAVRPITSGILLLFGAADTLDRDKSWHHFCFKDMWQVAHPLAAHRFMKQQFPEKSNAFKSEEEERKPLAAQLI